MEENNNTNTTPEEPKKSGSILDTPDTTADYDPADIEKNKLMGILSYFHLLVLIPLFVAKDSPYARFHVNQGLLVWILYIICNILTAILPILGIITLVPFALSILGIINVVNGKAKELPIIGKFRLLK